MTDEEKILQEIRALAGTLAQPHVQKVLILCHQDSSEMLKDALRMIDVKATLVIDQTIPQDKMFICPVIDSFTFISPFSLEDKFKYDL